MIIGFGFGSPLTSLLMLILTSVLSYLIFRAIRAGKARKPLSVEDARAERRAYYLAQRERARQMAKEFDLTDEEIERRLDDQFGRYGR